MGRLHVDANAREEEKKAHFRFFALPKILLALQACLTLRYEAVAGASTYLSLSQAIAYLAPHTSYVTGRQPTLQVEELTFRLIDVCGPGSRDSGAQ